MTEIGLRFGKLVIQSPEGVDKHHNRRFLCLCDCGTFSVVALTSLKRGNTKSCGCVKRSVLGDSARTHGSRHTPAYYSWWNMKTRCERKNSRYYADYGGRGIKICPRWLDFSNFLSDMGQPPNGMTLERRDNDGNYELSNCHWVSRKAQANNRRSSVWLELDGVTKTLQQWADQYNIGRSTISARLKVGWPIDRAIRTPKLK